MSIEEIDILKRALKREKAARKVAEKILEEKAAELYDLTQELKKSNLTLEEEVQVKTSELQGVFENINDAYIVMNLKGDVLKMNDAAVSLFGYDLDKESVNVHQLIFSEDRDYAFSSFNELVNKGVFTDYTARVNTKYNGVRWIHINSSIVYNNDKKPIAAQGIIRDITEARERELIINLINEVAKSILGKTDLYDISWVITNYISEYLKSEDCVIYIVNENDELEQVAAYGNKLDKSGVIANKIVIPMGQGIVGSVGESGIAEVVANTTHDARYIEDDQLRLSEISVPIISDGKVIGVIDSEHELENYFTVQHLNTLEKIASLVALQLKSAIDIRRREIAEAKNNELVVALEKSNDELQEYAHIVSHDLKSPLRSLSALFSWIKEDNEGKFDEVSLENFNLIDMTLEKMEQLISDILLYSSVSTENHSQQKVNLGDVVEDVKQFLYVPDHVEVNILNELPVVSGDRAKFQQLFQNLIGNAIKYNDKEKGEINVSCTEESSFYQFAIQDNGIGIADKDHDKIFKIFQSLNDEKDSSGIGLSIVKKIVDLYKGEIWLESELNKGTTFYFTIKK